MFSQKVFDQALLHTLFYRCIDGAFQIAAVLLGCCFDIVQQLAVAQKRRTSLQDFVVYIIVQINEVDNQFERIFLWRRLETIGKLQGFGVPRFISDIELVVGMRW